MFCKYCGTKLSEKAVICPHCGAQVGEFKGNAGNENVFAIIGFILSFFQPVAGLIFSVMGFKRSVKQGLPNKGLAMAGIIISSVYVAILVVYFALVVFAYVILLGSYLTDTVFMGIYNLATFF